MDIGKLIKRLMNKIKRGSLIHYLVFLISDFIFLPLLVFFSYKSGMAIWQNLTENVMSLDLLGLSQGTGIASAFNILKEFYIFVGGILLLYLFGVAFAYCLLTLFSYSIYLKKKIKLKRSVIYLVIVMIILIIYNIFAFMMFYLYGVSGSILAIIKLLVLLYLLQLYRISMLTEQKYFRGFLHRISAYKIHVKILLNLIISLLFLYLIYRVNKSIFFIALYADLYWLRINIINHHKK